jgi:nucleoid-associated protein YgaU
MFALSPIALAMGGPPQSEVPESKPVEVQPEVQTLSQPAVQPAPAVAAPQTVQTTGTTSTEEMEKATVQLIELEARLERVDDYLDVLSKKMAKANAEGNTSKVIELKARERESLANRKAISSKIEALKNKYPELRTAAAQQQNVQAPLPPVRALPPATVVSAPSTPNIVYHEVEMGDTLMNVSRKYFNSPEYFRQIAEANNITDLSYLPQGMMLKIDLNWAKGQAPAAYKPKAAPKPQVAASGIVYHVVAAGDTLMSISRKYFNSASYYRDIMSMNGITDPSQLKIGMRLKIDKSLKGKIPGGPTL